MTIDRRRLTARGVIASVLLGTDPPLLSARRLVRAGEIFGLSGGTIRVAVSRMVANGELSRQDRGYLLVGRLVERQARQATGQNPPMIGWGGQWEIVTATGAIASSREGEALRSAASTLRLARLRDGVWTRPCNLDPCRDPDARAIVAALCTTFVGRPDQPGGSLALADSLWDLHSWAGDAHELRSSINELTTQLDLGDLSDLGPGFIESAAVLRLLAHDPLLPPELTPPDWPAEPLRSDYATFDTAYRVALGKWLATSYRFG